MEQLLIPALRLPGLSLSNGAPGRPFTHQSIQLASPLALSILIPHFCMLTLVSFSARTCSSGTLSHWQQGKERMIFPLGLRKQPPNLNCYCSCPIPPCPPWSRCGEKECIGPKNGNSVYPKSMGVLLHPSKYKHT